MVVGFGSVTMAMANQTFFKCLCAHVISLEQTPSKMFRIIYDFPSQLRLVDPIATYLFTVLSSIYKTMSQPNLCENIKTTTSNSHLRLSSNPIASYPPVEHQQLRIFIRNGHDNQSSKLQTILKTQANECRQRICSSLPPPPLPPPTFDMGSSIIQSETSSLEAIIDPIPQNATWTPLTIAAENEKGLPSWTIEITGSMLHSTPSPSPIPFTTYLDRIEIFVNRKSNNTSDPHDPHRQYDKTYPLFWSRLMAPLNPPPLPLHPPENENNNSNSNSPPPQPQPQPQPNCETDCIRFKVFGNIPPRSIELQLTKRTLSPNSIFRKYKPTDRLISLLQCLGNEESLDDIVAALLQYARLNNLFDVNDRQYFFTNEELKVCFGGAVNEVKRLKFGALKSLLLTGFDGSKGVYVDEIDPVTLDYTVSFDAPGPDGCNFNKGTFCDMEIVRESEFVEKKNLVLLRSLGVDKLDNNTTSNPLISTMAEIKVIKEAAVWYLESTGVEEGMSERVVSSVFVERLFLGGIEVGDFDTGANKRRKVDETECDDDDDDDDDEFSFSTRDKVNALKVLAAKTNTNTNPSLSDSTRTTNEDRASAARVLDLQAQREFLESRLKSESSLRNNLISLINVIPS